MCFHSQGNRCWRVDRQSSLNVRRRRHVGKILHINISKLIFQVKCAGVSTILEYVLQVIPSLLHNRVGLKEIARYRDINPLKDDRVEPRPQFIFIGRRRRRRVRGSDVVEYLIGSSVDFKHYCPGRVLKFLHLQGDRN